MVITISKKEIFEEVEKRTSLEGAMLAERFEDIWASKEEGMFLDSFWIEGYTAVIQLMKRYLKSGAVSYKLDQYDADEVLNINIEMPARYSNLLDGSVVTDLKMLMACNILSGWLKVKAPEISGKYDEEARGYTEDLRVKLLWRESPDSRDDLVNKCHHDTKMIHPEFEFLEPARKDCVRIPPQWGKCGNSVDKEYVRKCDCKCNELHPFGFDA